MTESGAEEADQLRASWLAVGLPRPLQIDDKEEALTVHAESAAVYWIWQLLSFTASFEV